MSKFGYQSLGFGGGGSAAPEVTRQSDILHWWKLDEGTGSTASDSIATDSQDLALAGGATWAAGKAGSSLSLDGSGDYAHLDGGMTAHSGPYAITLWCYPTTSGANFRNIWMLGEYSSQGSNQNGHWLGFKSGSSFNFYHNYNNSNGFRAIHTATGKSLNRWYFLCGTFDNAGNIDFYVADASGSDGSSPDASVTDIGTLATASGQNDSLDSWMIGAGYGSSDFGGQVDDVRFYGVYLSESDANDIYNGGAGDFV